MPCSSKCRPEKSQRTAKKCELICKNDKACLTLIHAKGNRRGVSTYAEHVRSHGLVFGIVRYCSVLEKLLERATSKVDIEKQSKDKK